MLTLIAPSQPMLALIAKANLEGAESLSTEYLDAIFADTELEPALLPTSTKPSEFNYHLGRHGTHILYNTLYRSLVKMTQEEFDIYCGKHPADPSMRHELIAQGLWVERNLDERSVYLAAVDVLSRNMKYPPSCTITTTLRCNARCAYCYEKDVPRRDFDSSSVSALVDFIATIARENTTGAVALNWFGGEPLLNPELIEAVTSSLRDHDVPFAGYLITNGSLLTENIIKNRLDAWRIQDMQVTIDGMEEEYSARKAFFDEIDASYEHLMEKLEWVGQQGIHLHLRLNIDRRNATEQIETLRWLEQRLGQYETIVFYPAFLTGVSEPLDDDEKEQIVYHMLRVLRDPAKLTSDSKLYDLPRIRPCMRADPRSFSIDVAGNLFDCERKVGRPEEAIGSLRDGVIRTANQARANRNVRHECSACVFLPRCLGGCQANCEDGDAACMIDRYFVPAYARFLLD